MVQVNVNEGILEGEIVNNEYGGKFYSFKGIPYADPPVGDLRFKVSCTIVYYFVIYKFVNIFLFNVFARFFDV